MSADTTSVSRPLAADLDEDADLGSERVETAITVVATTLAILFVSFIAVLMGMA